jgi:EAL domain-containing protein (putative c-di-GMP-specific phosphodiesterase class I)
MGDRQNRDRGSKRNKMAWTHGSLRKPEVHSGDASEIPNIDTKDLSVVYQPIVDLHTMKVFGHEALARCTLEQFINPIELFSYAVKERFTGRLGRMLRELAVNRYHGERLFLNIHPDELAMRWLIRPDDPLNLCQTRLYVEITEAATFEHFDLCMDVLKELVARTGVQLVVDDFGAGYSNIRRIIDLEPQVVKS